MKNLWISLFMLLAASGVLNAQKLGHIDSQELLSLMPEREVAFNKVQQRATDYEKQLKAMKSEYDLKVQEYQSNPNMPEAVKQTKAQQIMQLEQDMTTFQGTAQQDLGDYENTLFTPIIEKARQAVADVAKENGFLYIFDASTGATVYEGGENVLPLVLKKMNIALPVGQ